MRIARRVVTSLTRTTLPAAAAVALAALGSPAAAQQPLPPAVPVPAAGSLVTEGITVEGPLVNNFTVPTGT